MSLLKKMGAVAVGAGSAAGFVAVSAVKAAFEAAAKKVGNGTYVASNGKEYTGENYTSAAEKCNGDIFIKGFKKAVELWKEDD